MYENPHLFKTHMISVEVWDCDGNLVAGELGYCVGNCYTSQTGRERIMIIFTIGFYKVSGTGTIQLCGLGKLLAKEGFQVWDFGMELGYKVVSLIKALIIVGSLRREIHSKRRVASPY